MHRPAVILVFCFLLCFAPAAQAANYYWGGSLTFSQLELDDFKLKFKHAAPYARQSINLKNDKDAYAAGVSFFYGLDFGWAGDIPLRLELDINLSDGISTSKKRDYFTPQGIPPVAFVDMELDLNWLLHAGLNLWADIPVGDFPLKPYAGGGLGWSLVSYDVEIVSNPGAAIQRHGSHSGRDLGYYYKLGAGARLAVGKRTFLDFSLQYMKKQDWSISASPFELDFSSRALSAGAGLRYYF